MQVWLQALLYQAGNRAFNNVLNRTLNKTPVLDREQEIERSLERLDKIEAHMSVEPAPLPAPLPEPTITIPIQRPQSSTTLTDVEIKEYQHREMGKELLLIEGHLRQGVKIAGKPCDCISPKHSTALEALAEESISINPNEADLYKQLAEFARELNYKAREDVVESGEFESEYPELAAKARGFRKLLLRSEEIAPSPEMSDRQTKREFLRTQMAKLEPEERERIKEKAKELVANELEEME